MRSALAMFGLLLCAIVPSAQPQAGPVPRPVPVPGDFLGLTVHRPFLLPQPPALAYSSLRLWDNRLRWSDLAPERGVLRFEAMDAYVAWAERHGKKLVYTLGQTPTWASSRPGERAVYGLGAAAVPADLADWQGYVAAVARRYRGRIETYEVWNEPKLVDSQGRCGGVVFFCGTLPELVALARSAHEVLRREDPAAKLATPAFDGGLAGAQKLDRYFEAGGAAYADVVAFHFYTYEPEAIGPIVDRLRAVMRRHGVGHLPIWNTESGYLVQDRSGSVIPEHGAGTFSRVFTPEQAGGRMARQMVMAAAAGVQRFMFYAWDNGRMGAIDPATLAPHALASGMDRTMRWITGAELSCGDGGSLGRHVCTVTREGRTSRIAWTADEAPPSNWFRRIPAGTVVETLDGEHHIAGPDRSFVWDGRPVLLSRPK